MRESGFYKIKMKNTTINRYGFKDCESMIVAKFLRLKPDLAFWLIAGYNVGLFENDIDIIGDKVL